MTASRRPQLESYPDHVHLHDGLDKMRGHLTTPAYIADREARRLLAAKAAVLVAHLRAGRAFDFAADRYSNSPALIEVLRAASHNGHALSWIDGIRNVNLTFSTGGGSET